MADHEEGSGGAKRFSKEWWRRLGHALWLAVKDFNVDNGQNWAAAIAFYGLLSMFPLLLAAVSIAAQIVDPEWAARQLAERMGDFLPQGEEQIREIIEEAHAAGAGAGFISFLLLMWTGSHVFAAMTTALNLAYDVEEMYGFFKRLLIRFLMLGTIGVFFLLALASQFLLNLSAAAFEHLPGGAGWFYPVLQIAAPLFLLLTAFFLIYRFVPRRRPDWRAALLGSAFATTGFLLARPLITEYLKRFGTDFNVIYGSLGIGIILLFWAWIVAVILLLGGEISSHVHAIVCEGQPVKQVEENHLARSPDHKELAGRRRSKRPAE